MSATMPLNIIHHPISNIAAIEEFYSAKDGVNIQYVCSSALGSDEYAVDIFYRDTPHPNFGNRYFAIRHDPYSDNSFIMNADRVEYLDFAMIEDSNGNLHYSAHRHDYKVIDGKIIDGGRAYVRTNTSNLRYFNIRDGQFAEISD